MADQIHMEKEEDIRLVHSMRDVDWTEAADLVARAPLGTRDPDLMRRAFAGSTEVCFAWCGSRLVGLARIAGDGVCHGVLYDLCILPEYQGRGLGRRIVEALLARCQGQTVLLYAVPGKEGFYRRFGFRGMSTAMARFSDEERMASLGYLRD